LWSREVSVISLAMKVLRYVRSGMFKVKPYSPPATDTVLRYSPKLVKETGKSPSQIWEDL